MPGTRDGTPEAMGGLATPFGYSVPKGAQCHGELLQEPSRACTAAWPRVWRTVMTHPAEMTCWSQRWLVAPAQIRGRRGPPVTPGMLRGETGPPGTPWTPRIDALYKLRSWFTGLRRLQARVRRSRVFTRLQERKGRLGSRPYNRNREGAENTDHYPWWSPKP